MKNLVESTTFNLVLSGWLGGMGFTVIVAGIRDTALPQPFLLGGLVGSSGALLLMATLIESEIIGDDEE